VQHVIKEFYPLSSLPGLLTTMSFQNISNLNMLFLLSFAYTYVDYIQNRQTAFICIDLLIVMCFKIKWWWWWWWKTEL